MFSGSYTAMVTPFKNGELDEVALRHNVNFQIENGTHGLVPVGTTGESPTVTEEEHKRVIQVVVEESAGRVPVIAGAGSNNPVEALAFAKAAEQSGADGILCVAGYYNRPSQEGLYQHFKYLHDATELPMIIYNIPPRAIVDIQPETMLRLAELPRVVGVKDATGDLARPSIEKHLIGSEFSYLSGEDLTAIAYNSVGGNGCISVTSNVAPKLCFELQQACLQGDYVKAQTVHEKLVPLHQSLFVEPSPAGIKYAMSLIGLCQEDVRLPIVPLQADSKERIKAAMQALNLL
ncbi:dihydrodipicolinate synthase [Marinomonas sp. SBI22]|uniref:4-hydroxy-tetrahydrodipicolinate synthase n=1 Tax=unclassified Marinomonas TaxID=196814 RepID=UPI0007AFBA69|nr:MULTISPECIES: 4-hydroxy-tetrahydrodipicolinate synthase [unclassified Marinomonas]KZM38733.1 dihydrodipicolinate synthase [Marinomonas sp. SBI22]KZM39388.1 dihydrodipicolinate synthase [Marinomonas sp. SBI8L]